MLLDHRIIVDFGVGRLKAGKETKAITPIAIYYRVAGQVIRVHAVLDCRRDPVQIAERLK